MKTTNVSRRAALAGLAVMAPIATAATVASTPAAPAADPVFEAIERHRVADAAWTAAINVVGNKDEDIDAAGHVARQALIAMVRTVPTAPTGVLTKVEYFLSLGLKAADGSYRSRVDDEEVDLPEELLRSLQPALRRLV